MLVELNNNEIYNYLEDATDRNIKQFMDQVDYYLFDKIITIIENNSSEIDIIQSIKDGVIYLCNQNDAQEYFYNYNFLIIPVDYNLFLVFE